MVRDTDTRSDDADESDDDGHAVFDATERSRREVLTKGTAGSVALAVGLTGTAGATSLQDDEDEEHEETETPEEKETETPDDEEEDEEEDEESAAIDFQNQESDGGTITIASTSLPEGGFVAIHDPTLFEGDALGSVIGVSEYLDEGDHEDVEVDLFDVPGAEFDESELTGTIPLIPMPHLDTDGDEEYGFVETDGREDGPYIRASQAVVDLGFVVVE